MAVPGRAESVEFCPASLCVEFEFLFQYDVKDWIIFDVETLTAAKEDREMADKVVVDVGVVDFAVFVFATLPLDFLATTAAARRVILYIFFN